MKRKLITLAILALLTINLACTKGELLSNAESVLSGVTRARPLITQLLPSAAGKIEQGVTIATKLKNAIADSDETEALAQLTALIPVFQGIVENDIPQIKSVAARTSIMAALAIADISLHVLVDRLQQHAPQVMAEARSDVLSEFASREVWGHRFKK
jgi:hypothetical protein